MLSGNLNTGLVFTSILLIFILVAPVLIVPAYSQASQWSWGSTNQTNCDGFPVPNVVHSGNQIAGIMTAPLIKVGYPDGTYLVDHPGLTGCPGSSGIPSYTYHFPHTHTSAGPPALTYEHAIWFVGGPCSDFVLAPPCYKYEQLNWFYNSYTGDPNYRHRYKMYGVGYYDTLGFPQYQNYFKVNADVLGPTNDKFRRYDGTNWGTVQYESSFFASGPTGVQFHSKDSSDESKFLAIAPSYYDGIPKVWVLRNNPGEDDPTFNDIDKTNQEPDIWVSGTTSVVNQDIVYWYKSYRTVTSSTCQPTAPCSVGPIVYLRGGL